MSDRRAGQRGALCGNTSPASTDFRKLKLLVPAFCFWAFPFFNLGYNILDDLNPQGFLGQPVESRAGYSIKAVEQEFFPCLFVTPQLLLLQIKGWLLSWHQLALVSMKCHLIISAEDLGHNAQFFPCLEQRAAWPRKNKILVVAGVMGLGLGRDHICWRHSCGAVILHITTLQRD